MVCSAIFSIDSIADLLVWPAGCDFYFYLKIFTGLFIILTWGLYKFEKKHRQDSEILSSMGVSSIAIFVLALIGTLIKNSDNIPMISSTVLLIIIAVTIPIILIWMFKK